MAISYSPVTVYSAPDSTPLGALILDNPEFAAIDQASCNIRPIIKTND